MPKNFNYYTTNIFHNYYLHSTQIFHNFLRCKQARVLSLLFFLCKHKLFYNSNAFIVQTILTVYATEMLNTYVDTHQHVTNNNIMDRYLDDVVKINWHLDDF